MELRPLALALAGSLLVTVAAPTLARADVDSPLVKKGLSAYAELDYATAAELLEQARAESLTREEKLVTYRTLAMAYVALGKLDEAKKDFRLLLHIDPSTTLDRSVAPKVRAVFEDAKAEAATSGRALAPALPSLTPQLEPLSAREGRPIGVRVDYPGGLARKMTVFYRKGGDPSYSRLTVAGDSKGRFAATLPGLAVAPPSLEYHIVLLDDAGGEIAAAGSLGQPLSVAVTRQKKPVYTRGWFWGVLGGVAAAGAVAATLAVVLPRSSSAPITVNAQ
jgi:tetratricopeptide (TPR) repeat protein